ncbi:MAG: S-layer homology domain-containing protein, partial [Ruminococcaceae bacterium]|nr:S-layer homology domain-containing protein [Oscillospiraceae bacterium]
MKRFLSLILCLTMILSLASVANAEHYSNFADVTPDSWYYEDVDNAVRLGIINGKTDTTFAPEDNLTYAEAIKLAACMYQLYKDGSVYLLSGGNPWYQIYVDYAKDHGIITENFFYKVSNINEKATRAGYMEIFANALPDEALEGINNVPDGSIPDVPMVHEGAIGIYKLYRAGILTGVDAKHNCKPEDNIKRCEVAAIITRMMNENVRIKFSMGESAEKPKTEEPKVEEPKLEIPKDAEFAPEIKEDEASTQKAETPDMYEPFEIVVEPERIDSADEGETLTYTVKASGGKTPYTYQWVSRGWHNQTTAIQESEYAKGTKTNTLSLTFSMDN